MTGLMEDTSIVTVEAQGNRRFAATTLSPKLRRIIRGTNEAKARVKRRTSHEPNPMLKRENKEFSSFAFNSAHVKYGV